jgi:hypothetical protein
MKSRSSQQCASSARKPGTPTTSTSRRNELVKIAIDRRQKQMEAETNRAASEVRALYHTVCDDPSAKSSGRRSREGWEDKKRIEGLQHCRIAGLNCDSSNVIDRV